MKLSIHKLPVNGASHRDSASVNEAPDRSCSGRETPDRVPRMTRDDSLTAAQMDGQALGWLACLAGLIVLLIQTGGLGNPDTRGRWQVTRWLWTDEPQTYERVFSAPGRGGARYAMWGVGQSVVMLPGDWIGAALSRRIASPELKDRIREALVAVVTFPLLDAFAVVLAALFLREIGFPRRAWILGSLGLLLASSFLKYCQNHQENSLMDLLTFAGAWGVLRWRNTGSRGALIAGISALGMGLLVRLPFAAVSVGILAAVLLSLKNATSVSSSRTDVRWREFVMIAFLVTAFWIGVERGYHFLRFGAWSGSYITAMAGALRAEDPTLPAGWPFSGNITEGFIGPLITPQRGVFFYDPLVLLPFMTGLAYVGSKLRLYPRFLVCAAAAFLLQVAFHAPHFTWEGAGNWANRFTLVPVHLFVCLAVAATAVAWPNLTRLRRAAVLGLVTLSVAIQLGSVVYPDALEDYAPGTHHKANGLAFDRPVWLVGYRWKSIWENVKGVEPTVPAVRALRRVHWWPALIGWQWPRLTWPAWTGWGCLLVLAGFSAGRLTRIARNPSTGLEQTAAKTPGRDFRRT